MSRGGDWIHPPTRIAIIWFRDGGRCLVCGWRPEERFGPGLVLDHVVPMSRWNDAIAQGRRGPHDPRNLATLCCTCHNTKGLRSPGEVFGRAMSRYLWERARRPLTKWHRRRGYLAAVRLGRYRRSYNAEKCARRRREDAIERDYLLEERAGILADSAA